MPVAMSASTSRSRAVMSGHGGRRLAGGSGRRGAAHEFGHQPARHAGGEQRVSRRDDLDRRDQVGRLGALEQEATGPGAQRRVHVLVQVEGGQDQHPGAVRPVRPGDLPGGLDAVHDRHPDVHQDDIGPGPAGLGDGLGAGAGLADDGETLGGADDAAEPGPDQGLIVGDDDPQRHRGPPGGRAAAGGGLIAPRPAAGTGR
jgi:hypothetical protein